MKKDWESTCPKLRLRANGGALPQPRECTRLGRHTINSARAPRQWGEPGEPVLAVPHLRKARGTWLVSVTKGTRVKLGVVLLAADEFAVEALTLKSRMDNN